MIDYLKATAKVRSGHTSISRSGRATGVNPNFAYNAMGIRAEQEPNSAHRRVPRAILTKYTPNPFLDGSDQ